MAKPALGRGLGSLMGGPKPPEPAAPATPEQPSAAPQTAAGLGRGVGTLLRGVGRDEPEPEPESQPGVSPEAEAQATESAGEITATARAGLHGVPRWSYFAGDILLVGFAAVVAFNTSAPLDLPRVVFCAVATGVGAWLGIQPFLSDYRARQQQRSTVDLPAWLIAEYRTPEGQTARLLIHSHRPLFIAKVAADGSSEPRFTPVAIDGAPTQTSEETGRLLREAEEYYRRAKTD